MLENFLRKKTQPFFDHVGSKVGQLLEPDTITFFSFVAGLCSSVSLLYKFKWVSVFFLISSGLLDALDGTVARLMNKSRKIGAYKDLVSDRMVESMFMLSFCYVYPEHAMSCLCFMVALLFHFSSFGIAASLFENSSEKSFHYTKNWVDRSEAFGIFVGMILFPAFASWFLMGLNFMIFLDGVKHFRAVLEWGKDV